jgi:protein gp37
MTKSKIEWTDRSWKLVKIVDGVAKLDEGQLTKPLQWRKPQRCFVGDLFAAGLTDTDIDKVFAVMALAPHITFQVLTKRPKRMLEYFTLLPDIIEDIADVAGKIMDQGDAAYSTVMQIGNKPLPNLWLGVSVHDQASADEFIPLLLETPAALRFVSYEPALGPVDWTQSVYRGSGGISMRGYLDDAAKPDDFYYWSPKIDWIIAGGESGPNARPPHPDWFRQTRDQCAEAGTPFFFKQWGEWATVETKKPKDATSNEAYAAAVSNKTHIFDDDQMMVRVGKSGAGNQLDGRTHQAFPDLIEGN